MSFDVDVLDVLRMFADAYPVEVFPEPPPDKRCVDGAAAQVMREVALPWFAKAADEIERLRAELDGSAQHAVALERALNAVQIRLTRSSSIVAFDVSRIIDEELTRG